MEEITLDGPWKQIRSDLEYEMNPSGVVRSIPVKRNRVVYLKPASGPNTAFRYQFYSNGKARKNKHSRLSITVRNLFKIVWGEAPEITVEDMRKLKRIAEEKNKENSANHQKKKAQAAAKTDDEPILVNGKPRYCIYCGEKLYKKDGNFFYHGVCYRARNDDMIEECFAGGHSYS